MTVAFAGMAMLAPTAVMTPFEKTIVPLGIIAEETGTMVALRMAISGFLPGLLMMTDWANIDVAIKHGSNAPTSRRRSSRRAAGATRLIIGHLRLWLVVALAGFGQLLVLRFVVRFLLQAILLLCRHLLAQGQVALAVEDDLAVDQRGFDARVGRERVAGPDGEVGILAGVDRSESMVEAELLCAVQPAELQRFLLREASLLHGLGRVL